MKNLLCLFLFTAGLTAGSALFSQVTNSATYNPNEIKEGGKNPEMINGYPATEFYFNQIGIPQTVLISTLPADKLNVAIHNKIVNWEKTNLRPINSLPKNDMESLMQSFKAEAQKEMNAITPVTQPK